MRFGCLKRSSSIVFASGRESYGLDYRGRLVDESMIIPRKRIQEMKVIERNYEPPAKWLDWEKQYFTRYDDFICELVRIDTITVDEYKAFFGSGDADAY